MPAKDLRKKIGQLFLVGFEGRNISPWLKQLFHDYHVGGVVLFSRNVSEPGQAFEMLRSFKVPGLLVAIDHEGGRVVRLPAPVTRFPPAGQLGLVNSPEMVRRSAVCQARELSAIGINFNFAPVLDVRSNPVNRVIADRSFSADAQAVGRLAREYVRGSLEVGVAPCGKHFPGHGDTREDSHELLPRVDTSPATLEQRELVPYRMALAAGLPAIMTAHVVHEGLDPTLPATLSQPVVGKLLRERLGFQGVVVTDDLEMKAVADNWDVEDRTLLALKAGADLLMYCHTPEVQIRAIETVYRAVDGRIVKPEQIEQSFARIQALKTACRKVQPAHNRDELMEMLNRSEHKALAASLG
ncbi:MAG: beta-N-acetylhexosaminidase [Deltaproteobacteria bacterium]|nr:beta-N-acetylhexosaminidase [Deltaproteobacteria bacterium]